MSSMPVEEDRLVGHRHELLGAGVGDRPQPGAGAAGEDQALHRRSIVGGAPARVCLVTTAAASHATGYRHERCAPITALGRPSAARLGVARRLRRAGPGAEHRASPLPRIGREHHDHRAGAEAVGSAPEADRRRGGQAAAPEVRPSGGSRVPRRSQVREEGRGRPQQAHQAGQARHRAVAGRAPRRSD